MFRSLMLRPLVALGLIAGLAAPALAQETRATAAAKFKREFAASDTNKDGFLTKPEVARRITNMKMGSAKFDAAQRAQLTDVWFARADANRDGKVSEAEAQALLAATFRRYDANGDGRIGSGERAAAKAGVRAGK